MNEHAIIYQMLASTTAISNLVSTRIYPVLAPEGAIFPAIVYRTTATQPIADADTDSRELAATVEVIALSKLEGANNYANLRTLANAVRTMGEANRLGFTPVGVNAVMDAMYLENERDEFFGDDLRVIGRVFSYRLMIRLT